MSDITPDTHFLESVRADRGSWSGLLAEGIDNSFDAGASEITIELRPHVVSLRDNGCGITRDRELAIVRFGEHRSMPTTGLGMFGIGLKYHAVSAGDRLDVESTSADGRMRLYADWPLVIRSGRWNIPDPTWVPTVKVTTGTHLRISNLRWQAPSQKDVQTAREKLAQLFYPALASHRRILINGEVLPILHEPTMNMIVEGDVRLPSGKGAHVRGGILVGRSSQLSMVQVSYKHRVILSKSTFGCHEFSGLTRMFARVDLIGPWTLARFKDGLADKEAVALEEAVTEVLRPVLEACHSASMDARVREMTTLVNELLPSGLVAARPRKQKDQKRHGRKRGIKRGRPSGDEAKSGPTKTARHGDRILISFEEPLVDECGYGQFLEGRGQVHRVQLSRDNAHIAALMEIRDKAIGARSLLQIALAIYLQARREKFGQAKLEFSGPFGLELWNLLKEQPADGPADSGIAEAM